MAREQESSSSLLSSKTPTSNISKLSAAATMDPCTTGCNPSISMDEDLVSGCRCPLQSATFFEEDKIKEEIGKSAIFSSEGCAVQHIHPLPADTPSSPSENSSGNILGIIDVFLNKIDAIADNDFHIELDDDATMSSMSCSSSCCSTFPSCCFLQDAGSNKSYGSSAITSASHIMSLSIPSAITWDDGDEFSIATHPTTSFLLPNGEEEETSLLLF